MSAPNILMADVIGNDAFSCVQMTDAINKMPFVPGRAGSLGIFAESGILTNTVAIEEDAGSLALIPNTQRGAPPNQNAHGKRTLRYLSVPHFPLEDTVLASELQGIRAFGTGQLQDWATVRDKRLQDMYSKHDATCEYGRIGAIKGTILDADGSTVIYNLFDEFGVTQDSVNFALGTPTTSVKSKCMAVKRLIEVELGAATYDHIHAFCGSTWFDAFTEHPMVRDTYAHYLEGGRVLQGDNRRGFEFGGIVFEEYPGKIGSVDFVAANECHFFPVGVPGLFRTAFAPPEWLETVNTIGRPRYAKAEARKYNMGIDVLTESNPLSYCNRPKVLVKGTNS